MTGPVRVAIATVMLAFAALVWAAQYAHANGVPQLVKLTYIEGVSNWGPVDGEGVLEFSFAEAYARVDVKNLLPQEGYSYEGWMLGPGGDRLFVGAIPVDADGLGALETSLPGDVDELNLDTFVVAGRGESTPEGELPDDLSIAGYFTVLSDDGTGAGGDARPPTLPDAGQEPLGGASNMARLLRPVAAMGAVTVAIGIFMRARRRKETRS